MPLPSPPSVRARVVHERRTTCDLSDREVSEAIYAAALRKAGIDFDTATTTVSAAYTAPDRSSPIEAPHLSARVTIVERLDQDDSHPSRLEVEHAADQNRLSIQR